MGRIVGFEPTHDGATIRCTITTNLLKSKLIFNALLLYQKTIKFVKSFIIFLSFHLLFSINIRFMKFINQIIQIKMNITFSD